jgi:mercuric ion transport protein
MSSPIQNPAPILSKRRLGLASAAAFLGCAACCALPLLAAAGVGSGTLALLSSVFRPGSELVVGGGVFLVALGVMAIWNRSNSSERSGCGPACKVDGSCCARGAEQRSA